MPESPVHNPMGVAPSPDPSLAGSAEAEGDDTVAFLPPRVSRLLIAGWIVLFAGRWLVVQGMVAAGLLAPELVENLDANVLGRCYLLLLSVTLVTLIVRIVRSRDPHRDPLGSKTDFNAQGRQGSGVEGTGEAESSDRGGKRA